MVREHLKHERFESLTLLTATGILRKIKKTGPDGGKMIDKTDFIGSVTEKLQGLVNNGPAQPLKEDLEKNIKSILSSAFSKMELLTREEFDTQVAVLQRTREMVEALEQRVAELEQQIAPQAEE